jgi:hypothetical protein
VKNAKLKKGEIVLQHAGSVSATKWRDKKLWLWYPTIIITKPGLWQYMKLFRRFLNISILNAMITYRSNTGNKNRAFVIQNWVSWEAVYKICRFCGSQSLALQSSNTVPRVTEKKER